MPPDRPCPYACRSRQRRATRACLRAARSWRTEHFEGDAKRLGIHYAPHADRRAGSGILDASIVTGNIFTALMGTKADSRRNLRRQLNTWLAFRR